MNPRTVPSPEAIAADFSSSYWLKDAVQTAIRRDPVDALRDAETLVAVLTARLERMGAR